MSFTKAPFYLVSAFSSSASGGNPAGIVFLEPSLPLDFTRKISENLNQPMTAFVSPIALPSDDDQIEVRNIKYIAPSGQEVPICGHATLAAGKVIFGFPEVAARGVHTIHFKTTQGDTLKAVKLEDGHIEIRIPSTSPGSVSDEEKSRLKTFVDKAFGRDVLISDIKNGGLSYETYVMVELNESEDLAGSVVKAKELVGNGFDVNIFTVLSPNPEEVFLLRMFAPAVIPEPSEDAVCGSAHGVLVPYWYGKLGIKAGKEIRSRQVSSRGGHLKVVLEEGEKVVVLRGQATVFGNGDLHLQL